MYLTVDSRRQGHKRWVIHWSEVRLFSEDDFGVGFVGIEEDVVAGLHVGFRPEGIYQEVVLVGDAGDQQGETQGGEGGLGDVGLQETEA